MKKIALIGTHDTRKTTKCYAIVGKLKEKGVNAEYLGEIARETRSHGFEINEGTTKASQEWILHTQIARELELGTRKDIDIIICDRSVLDNYMYYVNSFGYNPSLDVLVRDWVKSYDLLFKLPIRKNKSRNGDPVRATDPKFQRKIDKLVGGILSDWDIPFVRYSSHKEALEKIMEIL